jgi:hypothetical protein
MLLKPSSIIRPLVIFALILMGLVGSLYWLNASKSAFYFSNRVVADKSLNPKYPLPVSDSTFTLSQLIDKSRFNVSDSRFLSDPLCLSLALNAPPISPNPPAQFTISLADRSTELASWSVDSGSLSRDYLKVCSSGQMVLNDLVSAEQPQIVVSSKASHEPIRAVFHLSELTHGQPVLVNNSPVTDRTLPFKIDVVGSPTILDTLKYVFLAVVAGLIILIALLATRKDLQHLKTQRITKTKS